MFCYLLLHPRLSDTGFATQRRPDRLSDSSQPTNDSPLSYLGCFNRLAARNDEELRAIHDKMRWNFTPYYGLSKLAAWESLHGCMNPLDWFLLEKQYRLASPITLWSEDQKLQSACVAAAILKKDLGWTSQGNETIRGIFLSEGAYQCNVPIVFDSGASDSVTPFAEDFVSEIAPPDTDQMGGLSGSTQVTGMGLVEWEVRDSFGNTSKIRTVAYLIPEASIRLFSPQRYCSTGSAHFAGDGDNILFTSTNEGQELVMTYQPHNRLPLLTMAAEDEVAYAGISMKMALPSTASTTIEARELLMQENYNMRPDQKELCLWHQRLCHAGFSWVQDLMRPKKNEYGTDPEPAVIQLSKHLQSASCCDIPKCAGCLYAKMHRISTGSQVTRDRPEKEMAIRRGAMHPGDRVSVDQYQSTTLGRKAHTKGKEDESQKYNGGTIFVDHYSGYVHVKHQVSLATGETLGSKHDFEQLARLYGISVKGYHTDNHPFSSKEFQEDLELQGQKFTTSGVSAHFQNGVAERAIQTITSWARAMLMHQLLHWPDMFEPELWPFAMEHAVHMWNHLPKTRSGLTPHEMFTGMKQPEHTAIIRSRVWGCPVYVLDPKLCDGHKLPKWQNRARIGMYLGSSPNHAENIGRVLNFETGYVSAQFHLVYDELFTTTLGYVADAVIDPDLWRQLIMLGGEENNLDEHDRKNPTVRRVATDLFKEFCHDNDPQQDLVDPVSEGEENDDDETSSTSEGEQSENPVSADSAGSVEPPVPSTGTRSSLRRSGRTKHPRSFLHDEQAQAQRLGNVADQDTKRVRFRSDVDLTKTLTPEGVETPVSSKQPTEDYVREALSTAPQLLTATLLQKPRPRPVTSVYDKYVQQAYLAGGNDKQKVRAGTLYNQMIHGLDWNPDTFLQANYSSTTKKTLLLLLQVNNSSGEWSPLALQAKAGDEDTPTWDQAMNGPHAEGYRKACDIEYNALVSMEVWEEVARQAWMNVLPSTWAFKRKVFPNGEVRKLKARFCARGDRQIFGVDYHDTFAPVVNWTTVRLLLTLSAQLGLATTQVDYTAAFVHADIDVPPGYDKMSPDEQEKCGVYVEMPRGYAKPGMVLKLKKSLYGLKQSPRNFFQHLKSKLERVGFEQQVDVDSCLFISDKVICLVYVDDTLLYARDQKDIDEVLRRLQEDEGMQLEVESDVAGFLGVQIHRDDKTGETKLTQTGLISRIIEALHIEDLPALDVPADTCLGKDEFGDPAQCTFNYASVIGMMWYLYGHSRPDLGFAVSQAARFAFAPKRSHELALIQIGQYLKGTSDEGMILKPLQRDKFHMDVYVDADFMGLYGKEQRTDPDNVKSRTGFVIMLNGCPIVWASKLQASISLSTMMAEYYALSTAMREVLPIRDRVTAVATGFEIDPECLTESRPRSGKTTWELSP